jgi:membrane fusion protein, multidrug efflux system
MAKITNSHRGPIRSPFLIPIVLLSIVAGVTWFGSVRSRSLTSGRADVAAKSAAAPVPVMADQVRRLDVPIYLEGIGVVRAFNTVTVRARVEGEIDKIAFREGQDVNAGDPLAKIDPRPFQAQLDEAKAKKAGDEARLVNAKLDLQRGIDLVSRGAGSRQAADTEQALATQLAADVQADQAAIDSATVQLGYTNITAPISGRVGMRLVDQGNIVRSSDTTGIVTINQIRPISVDFALPADRLPRVRAAMKSGDIPVTAQDSNGNDLAQGKFAVFDNHVDAATATIGCRAIFDNADEALWPGQFVNVLLRLDIRHAALTVPKTAIVRGPDGTYAFVIDANHVAQKRAVKVGFLDKTVAVIDDGLQLGDQVVTDGQYRIQAGTVVEVVPPARAGTT